MFSFERKIFKIPHSKNYLLFLPSLVALYEVHPLIILMLDSKLGCTIKNIKNNGNRYSKDTLLSAYNELISFLKVTNNKIRHIPAWGNGFLNEIKKYQICTMDIFLTHVCNMNCSYCCELGGDFGLKLRPKIMSWRTAKKTLDWLFKNNENGRYPLTISFFGGEPLLNLKVLKKSLEYIKKKRRARNYPTIKQVITTNGTLLNDEVLRLLNKYGCELYVSIDYPKHTHNKNRCFKDGGKTYDIVVKKVKSALKAYPDIKITTLSTIGEFANIRGILSDFPFDNKVDKMHNIEQSLKKNGNYYEKVLKKLSDEYKKQYHTILRNSTDSFKLSSWISSRFNSAGTDVIYRKTNCSAGLTKVAVTTNGDIYLCALGLYQRDRWKMGNVFTGFNRQKKRCLKNKFKQLLHDRQICAFCWARYLCVGPCPINNNLNFRPSLDDKNVICDYIRNQTEAGLRLYALARSEDNLKELYPVSLNDNQRKDVLTFQELAKYTFKFRELSNQRRNFIKHITPFSPG